MSIGRPFQIGDTVLADFDGAQIPGVVEDVQDDRAYVRLSRPWTDETGQQSDTLWLPFHRLSHAVDDTQALPG